MTTFGTTSIQPLASPERPWLGLRAYTLATAAYFYGRDREVDELYRRIRLEPLTLLYGKSGLGKTSLLGAGLLPRLKVEGWRPVLIRLRFDPDAPTLLQQVQDELAVALETSAAPMWQQAFDPERRKAVDLQRPVLIFDQFEELYTLAAATSGTEGAEQRRDRRHEVAQLMAELAAVIERRPPASHSMSDARSAAIGETEASEYDWRESALRIVLTLRDDYLHELERWKKLIPALMRNRVELRELRGPDALDVVMLPARKGSHALIDAEVAHRLICFVADKRDPATPLEDIDAVPPLLSLLCTELNEARLHAGAEQITLGQLLQGEADQVLERFYQRSFEGMPPGVRRTVEDLLIDNGGRIREASSRDTVVSEMRGHGVDAPERHLAALVDGRLLTVEERGGAPRVELTHDLLVPLVARARDKRQSEEQRAEADQRIKQVNLQLQKARQEQRRSRLLSIAMTALALSSAALGWTAYQNGKLAEARAEQITQEREAKDAERVRADKAERRQRLHQDIANLWRSADTISNDDIPAITELRLEAQDLQDLNALENLASLVNKFSTKFAANQRAPRTSTPPTAPTGAPISDLASVQPRDEAPPNQDSAALNLISQELSAMRAALAMLDQTSAKSGVLQALDEASLARSKHKLDAAAAAYARALAAAKTYAQFAGESDRWGQLMSADIAREHGELMLNGLNKPDEAITLFEQSLSFARQLKPDDRTWRLFAPLQPTAYAFRAKGEPEKAKEWFQRAYEAAQLTEGHNGLKAGQNGNSLSTLINWGNFLIERGEHAGALARSQDALRLYEALRRVDPTNTWISERGPEALRLGAKAHEGLKQYVEAISMFEQAIALSSKQQSGDPALPVGVNIATLDGLFCLARVLRSKGDEARAKDELGRTKGLARRYLEVLPNDEWVKWLSREIEALESGRPTAQQVVDAKQNAAQLRDDGKLADSSLAYSNALATAEKYAQSAIEEDRWGQLMAADITREHGELLLNRLDKPDEAIKLFEQSLDFARQLKPDDRTWRLFAPLQPMAYAFRAKGEPEKAKEWFQRAYEAAQLTEGHNGLKAGQNGNSLSTLINWGNFLIERGEHAGALARSQDALRLYEALRRVDPTNTWISERGPEALRLGAKAHEGLKQYVEAISMFEQAIALSSKQQSGDSRLPVGVNVATLDGRFCLARVLRSKGDTAEARAELGQAKALAERYLVVFPEDEWVKGLLVEMERVESSADPLEADQP